MTTTTTLPTTTTNPLPPSVQAAPDWRTAVTDWIRNKINQGECFSSGEIARDLRLHRPDLAFSVLTLGEYVRDLFFAGSMDLYDDGMGGLLSPCMVPRVTTGLGRTPAGQTVLVYGPDPNDCENHLFEVDIPSPPGQTSGKGFATGQIAQTLPPPLPAASPRVPPTNLPSNLPISITGSRAPSGDSQAKVHTDNRLCIPIGAFQKLVAAVGHILRGGDPIYLRWEQDQLIVSLDSVSNSTKYDLARQRGRVLVAHPTTPFTPGDTYQIELDTQNKELVIDLSQTV